MPLSLLLTQQLTLLTKGVRQLAAWEGLTDTFALVAKRLRSSFLVRWFGTALPVEGLDLKVTIVNLDELRARYGLVTAGNRGAGSGGPNLTEPLLGAGGMLAGALASPLNAMVAIVLVESFLGRWWQRLIAGLGWISAGGLVTAALLVAAPLVALGLIASGFGGQASDRHDLLGALAAMALPLQRLWAQLTRREPARNPLLRQLLTLGDRLAALLAQMVGAIAVAVTRIAPVLRPVTDAARATIAAVGQIIEAIRLVVQDILTAFGLLLRGPGSVPAIVTSVVAAARALVDRLGGMVDATLTELLEIALERFGLTLLAIVVFVVDAARLVKAVILDQAFVRWLRSLGGLAETFRAWRSRPGPPATATPSSKKPPSPWVTSLVPPSVRAFGKALGLTPTVPLPTLTAPPFVGLENLAPIAEAMRAGLLFAPPDPFALGTGQRDALRRFRRPPSVLGALKAELDEGRKASAEGGRAFALADIYAGLRPYVTRSIELLAPGPAASVLPAIEGLLDRLDVELRGRRATYPTRDLPEPAEVRPVVGRLVVRTGGVPDTEGQFRSFVATLRRELDTRPYTVAPSGGR